MTSRERNPSMMTASLTLILFLAGPAPSWAAADAPIKIRIAYPSGMNGQIPVTMERADIAKKHGLAAEFTFFQYGPPMMEALASGHVDAVITSLMPVTTFLARQPGAAVVVADLGTSSYSLMVAKESTVKRIEDLKGKRIAISFGSDSHLDLLRLLKERGLDAKADVNLLNVQPNELVLTLNEGYAEAVVIRQPQVLKMQEQFGARIVHTWPFAFVSIMRTAFVAEQPDVVRRYREALRESIYYIAKNKEQTSQWFAEKLRVDPEVVRKASMDDSNYHTFESLKDVSVELTTTVRRKISDWFASSLEHGMIKTPVSTQADKVFAN